MKNLYAYTALTQTYPEFISINLDSNGSTQVIVRSEAKADGSCGDTASITLTPKQAREVGHLLLHSQNFPKDYR